VTVTVDAVLTVAKRVKNDIRTAAEFLVADPDACVEDIDMSARSGL
jgi:hypothetical protein